VNELSPVRSMRVMSVGISLHIARADDAGAMRNFSECSSDVLIEHAAHSDLPYVSWISRSEFPRRPVTKYGIDTDRFSHQASGRSNCLISLSGK